MVIVSLHLIFDAVLSVLDVCFAAVFYLGSADLCCVVSAGFLAPGSEIWRTPALLVSHALPPAEQKINDESSSVQGVNAFK